MEDVNAAIEQVGIVVIGYNQAYRLTPVLRSAIGQAKYVIYADSGSADRSEQTALELGIPTVVLDDPSLRTAARNRNSGFALLRKQAPNVKYVQFLDGDTILRPGWIECAVSYLDAHADVHVVAGRLYEQNRNRNVYHRLADMEWNGSTGEVDCVGGNMLVRSDAFDEVGGFDPTVAAGEEQDLCLRIRQRGGRVVRLTSPMADHDIAMDRFIQWWRRMERGGGAYANTLWRQGITDPQQLRKVASDLTWGAALPAVALGFVPATLGASLSLFLGYPVIWARARSDRLQKGDLNADAALYATACVVAKFAESSGIIRFGWKLVKDQRRKSSA